MHKSCIYFLYKRLNSHKFLHFLHLRFDPSVHYSGSFLELCFDELRIFFEHGTSVVVGFEVFGQDL